MCSPEIAKIVRERVAREGRPQFSRRDFLRLGGMSASGLALAAAPSLVRPALAQAATSVVDLSHVFSVEMPTYLPGEGPSRETQVTVENDGFYIQKWTLGEHSGTHCDIPAHFVSGGETVDNYAVENLVSPAVVIDISAKAADDADAEVLVEDLEAWESENGAIPDNALVFMYSGWDAKFEDAEAFRNADADGVMHFPGFSPDAALWLLENRNIHGIGVDTLSLDYGASTSFDVHVSVLSAGKYGIEGVNNLSAIMGTQATVVLGVPRWQAGSGGPARLLALVSA